MDIPTSRDLVRQMLQVALEQRCLSERDLHSFLAFQFGVFDCELASSKPSDVRRFGCRVRVARRALLREGLLESGPRDSLKLTSRGEAYLASGCRPWEDPVSEEPVSGEPVSEASAAPGDPDEVDIKALLDEARFKSFDLGSGWYQVIFESRLRSWAVVARAANGWLYLRANILSLPEGAGPRAAVIERASRLNAKLPAVKFTVATLIRADHLQLSLEYRIDHVDGEVLGNLILMLMSIAEAEYIGLARIAVGDPSLQSLEAAEAAFKRSE